MASPKPVQAARPKPLDRFFYGTPDKPKRTPAPKPGVTAPKPAATTARAAKTASKPTARTSKPKPATRPATPPPPAAPRKPKALRPWRRLPLANSLGRLRVMLILVAVVFSLAAGRAVQVQAVDANGVAAAAAKQMTVTRAIPAFRGEITDRNGEVLAFTEATVKVYADPAMIQSNGKDDASMTERDREFAAAAPQKIADLLARYLGGDAATYLPLLTKEKKDKPGELLQYSIVATNVSSVAYSELTAAMAEEGLIGIGKESAPTRRYPNGTLAANIIGFVNEAGQGSGGLELALDKTLSGTAGLEVFESSPNGRIPGTSEVIPARNGQDYQLTIDAGLQYQVEQVLADRVRLTEATSGVAVVMNVKTGEVLALANFPTYDPNDYGSYDLADLGNRAVTDAYTPGSVQKTLTFAAMMDAGIVRPTDIVEVPDRIKSGDDWIHDASSHGDITLYARGVLAKSSNIGTIKLARKMKTADLQAYMVSFGLGTRTGLGLPGESAGILPGPDMADYTRDGLAFGGSGVAVTAIQEAAAVAAVTNGGIYNQPRIIASTTRADGTVEQLSVSEPRRVISEETSKEVVSLMETMAANTAAHTFDVPGYRIGAKTGTSRKLDPKTGKSTGLVTSVIGVGPVEDPQLLVYVVIDDAKRGSSGQGVAGPAQQDIMQLALARYGVAPSKSKSPKLSVAP